MSDIFQSAIDQAIATLSENERSVLKGANLTLEETGRILHLLGKLQTPTAENRESVFRGGLSAQNITINEALKVVLQERRGGEKRQ